MSVMEVDAWFYDSRVLDEVARQISRGLDEQSARLVAREIVGRAFVSRAAQLQCEFEADYGDYIWNMERGGGPYRGR